MQSAQVIVGIYPALYPVAAFRILRRTNKSRQLRRRGWICLVVGHASSAGKRRCRKQRLSAYRLFNRREYRRMIKSTPLKTATAFYGFQLTRRGIFAGAGCLTLSLLPVAASAKTQRQVIARKERPT